MKTAVPTIRRAHLTFLLSLALGLPFASRAEDARQHFNADTDLLLAQFDSKTDVDDIHSVAAFATIVANPKFSKLNYHAVAGAYGVQEGLYVPANELFALSFADKWSDAHTDFDQALTEVHKLSATTLVAGGDVWIAECGQSDFTAAVLRKIKTSHPSIDTKKRIHVIQHSDWNQNSADPEKLAFVKSETNYAKIPDGNAVGNGTAGYNTKDPIAWSNDIKDPHLTEVWQTAISIANKYNGQEGRYLNHSIAEGGFDFSDMAEVVWILNLENVPDTAAFFSVFGK